MRRSTGDGLSHGTSFAALHTNTNTNTLRLSLEEDRHELDEGTTCQGPPWSDKNNKIHLPLWISMSFALGLGDVAVRFVNLES